MNKLFKLFTILTLSIITICSSLVFVKGYGSGFKTKGDFTYVLNGKNAQIVWYNGKSSTVKIPAEIDGNKVVKIGIDATDEYIDDFDYSEHYGFAGNKYIKSVTVPNTVTRIATASFADCPNLKNVSIGKGVKCISLLLFDNCKELKSISLPSSITEIDELAFRNSGLKTISIGKNVKYISRAAFENSKLTKITVSSKNKKYSSASGVLYNKNKTNLHIYPNCRKGTKFTIPKTVKQVMPYAFTGNKTLNKVVFSKSINKIGSNSFEKRKKLKKVVFKSKKKIKIAPRAFMNCKALKSVTVPKNVIKIATKAFGFYSYTDKNGDYKEAKIEGFTIKGKKGSTAYKYAKKYKFKFVPEK